MRADRKKVEPLVKTARGQVDAVLKMIDEDRYCIDIVTQLAAAESLLRKARHAVLRGHMDGCVYEALTCGDPQQRAQKIDEIIALLDKAER